MFRRRLSVLCATPRVAPIATRCFTTTARVAGVPPVLPTITAMRKQRAEWGTGSVGFVPTMGALHAGHIQLVKRAKAENDRVVVSIYVNPTQFGAGEDFSKYPRQLAADCEKLTGLADAVFSPSDALMYSRSPPHATFVTVNGLHVDSDSASPALATAAAALTSVEARARPTHFRGVATVVTKLFNIVQPTRSYFGAKDGMQCILIRRIVRELNQPTKLVICPTERDPDGLAMSSRNVYLSKSERAVAPTVYRALKAGKKVFESGDRSVSGIQRAVTDVLSAEPAFTIQYVSIADTLTGAELLPGATLPSAAASVDGESDAADRSGGVAMLSVAVKLGTTRLIDNIIIGAD